MWESVLVLFGAAFTAATSIAIGAVALRRAGVKLHFGEGLPLSFITGSAVLSLTVFGLLAAHLAYPAVFLALGAAAIVYSWRTGALRSPEHRFEPLSRFWSWLFIVGFACFTALYLVVAMAPEMSPDGMTYHLSFVARYLREHSLVKIPYNMYAQLSQGIEMLFVFAFAFGKHSAAAMVHYTFLVAVTFLILSFGRRIGQPAVGVTAALFFYTSPVVGIDGTAAYLDVAVAAIVFTVFYLLQIWDDNRTHGVLILIGLVAGFAYAAKYTAFLAVPYAIAIVAWRARKLAPALIVGLTSTAMISPWVIKNLLWVGNPVSPMLNRVFPNSFVHIAFEEHWSAYLRQYGVASRWEIPWQLTVAGEKLSGHIGPLFLLLPLALLALRHDWGRRLLIPAAIYSCTYFGNIGARFTIPALPFWSLAIALALASYPRILAAAAGLACLLCWPSVLRTYSAPHVWALEAKFPVRAALRIESVDSYIGRKNPWYTIARVFEGVTLPGSRIFAFNARPDSYTSREVAVSFQSARGETLADMFYSVFDEAQQPRIRRAFHFSRRPVRTFRLVQTKLATDPDQQWAMHEIRVLQSGVELQRAPAWRLTASPNPWDAQLAFDNSPVTRWRAFERLRPGQYLEVDLGAPQAIDEIAIETSASQTDVDLHMDVLEGDGSWRSLADRATDVALPRSGFMGKLATAEMKARGFDYIVIDDNEWGAAEILEGPAAWGLKEVGRAGPARLYKIMVDGPKLKAVR